MGVSNERQAFIRGDTADTDELKMSYEETKTRAQRAQPYTKIVGELPDMRRETVDLVQQAITTGRRAYALVNNRTEGNAPLTIQALSDRLQGTR